MSRVKKRVKDRYAVLMVTRDATPDEIRRAHRLLARASHPDGWPGEGLPPHLRNLFHSVQEAYEVLRDEKMRAAHDRELGIAAQPTTRPAVCSSRLDLLA